MCEQCGRWLPWGQLVRTPVRLKVSAGSNYFPYSVYNTSGWACTASDEGEISAGKRGYFDKVDMSKRYTDYDAGTETTTETNGCQTWEGDGDMVCSSSVDCSSWTTALLYCRAGLYQRKISGVTDYSFTVALEARNGETTYTIGTRTVRCATDVWGVLTLTDVLEAHRSALTFAYSVTTPSGAEKWWIEPMALMKDLTSIKMANVIRTSGAAATRATDQTGEGFRVVCKKCKERLPKTWDDDDTGAFDGNEIEDVAEDWQGI